jgi:hypothetical protein
MVLRKSKTHFCQVICYPLFVLGLLLSSGPAQSDIVDVQRSALEDGIVHYTFDVDLGPNQFDTVRLHRIVREKREGKPVATIDGIFMLPGAPNFFEMIFLPSVVSDVPPWDQSMAIFLAKNGIDVWGMDYAWALVPPGTTDFGFMEGWGLQKEIGYAEQALEIVRAIRRATGQGNRRLHVLGFSYGVPIAYGIAGNETQLPPGKRRVKGIISVDFDMKVKEGPDRDLACVSADNGQDRIDDGSFVNDQGFLLNAIGSLAEFAPDAPSPIPDFAGLTNWQVAILLGAIDAPTWHFVAGEFHESGLPTGLQFTEPDLWIDLLQYVPFFLPRQAMVDVNTTRCDEDEVPFDDYLGDITVPIFAVGAAGGAAPDPYTPSLTSSQDIEQFTVQFLPDDLHALDFGHADIFTANEAEEFTWQPILTWLKAHRAQRTFP